MARIVARPIGGPSCCWIVFDQLERRTAAPTHVKAHGCVFRVRHAAGYTGVVGHDEAGHFLVITPARYAGADDFAGAQIPQYFFNPTYAIQFLGLVVLAQRGNRLDARGHKAFGVIGGPLLKDAYDFFVATTEMVLKLTLSGSLFSYTFEV